MKVQWQINAGRFRQTLGQCGKRDEAEPPLFSVLSSSASARFLLRQAAAVHFCLGPNWASAISENIDSQEGTLLRSGSSRNLALEFYVPRGYTNQDCERDPRVMLDET